ncbi:sensor histidine kinase [Thermovibrio sp.]
MIEEIGRAFEELIVVNDKGEVVGRNKKFWELFPSSEALKAFKEVFTIGESSFEFEERERSYLVKGKLVKELALFLKEDITLKKEVDSLKREVISTLSHEIRTPLTVIRGNAELSLELGADRESLETIVKKSKEIEELLKGLRKLFDKPGKFPLINLKPITLEVVNAYRERAREKGVLLKASLSEVNLPAEPILYKQLLRNLIDNAVKFTERGKIEVVLKREFLRVSDTGRGIKKEERERIFEKFFKGKGSSGQGIGLSVVKEIAKFHGWKVEVESEEGKGSSFTVYL